MSHEKGNHAPANDALLPLWERSPKKFWTLHEALLEDAFQEMEASGEAVSMSKFIARHLDDLPDGLPSDVLMRLTRLAIDVFERKMAEKTTAVLA